MTTEPAKAGDDAVPVTIYDLQTDPEAKVDLRRLPRLTALGLRMVWAASPGDFLASALLQLVGGGGIAALLLLGQRALDVLLVAVTEHRPLGTVLPWALAISAVTAIQSFANAVQRERQQVLGEVVARHVQRQVLDVAAAADLVAFETPSFHNRMHRIQSSQHQPLNIVWGVSGLVSAATGVVSVLVALAVIDPLVVPLVIVVFFPAWLVASRRGEAFYRFFWNMTPRDRERQYVAGLLTDRDAAKEVRAFGLGNALLRHYERLYDERILELRKVARRHVAFSLVANLAIAGVLAATLLLIGWLTLTGRVSLSEAAIAVGGIALVGGRLTSAGFAAGSLAEAGLYLGDFLSFIEASGAATGEVPATAPEPSPVDPQGFSRIDVEGVSFSYPSARGPAALDDVSLTVRAGEVVALVGENGSGKTTLAKLLAGLYRPDSGRITWDGVDVETIEPARVRRSIAVIFQDFTRFHLRARDNIGFGDMNRYTRATLAGNDHDVDLIGVEEAARHADAYEFLSELPKGLDTLLGPEFWGGTDLSVGQWQRVALARAFYRGAPFVLLDEPTASLDARAEHELFERIRTLLTGRTVLLISHRFSSVRAADRIYVLSHGGIVEAGTHEELMAAGGLYAELFTLQAAAYQDVQS